MSCNLNLKPEAISADSSLVEVTYLSRAIIWGSFTEVQIKCIKDKLALFPPDLSRFKLVAAAIEMREGNYKVGNIYLKWLQEAYPAESRLLRVDIKKNQSQEDGKDRDEKIKKIINEILTSFPGEKNLADPLLYSTKIYAESGRPDSEEKRAVFEQFAGNNCNSPVFDYDKFFTQRVLANTISNLSRNPAIALEMLKNIIENEQISSSFKAVTQTKVALIYFRDKTNGMVNELMNKREALHCFEEIISNDHAPGFTKTLAKHLLAMIHCEGGAGIETNKKKALELWSAVVEGCRASPVVRTEAKFNIGVILYNGAKNVERNTHEAFNIWSEIISDSKASSLYKSKAKYNLGLLYCKGSEGVPTNLREALRLWLEVIQDEHAPVEIQNLAKMSVAKGYSKGGEGVAKNTREAFRLWSEIIQDEKTSPEMKSKAKFGLANLYCDGADGVLMDKKRSLQLWSEVIQENETLPLLENRAKFLSAFTYCYGQGGVEVDEKTALKYAFELIEDTQAPHALKIKARILAASIYTEGQNPDAQKALLLWSEIVKDNETTPEEKVESKLISAKIYFDKVPRITENVSQGLRLFKEILVEYPESPQAQEVKSRLPALIHKYEKSKDKELSKIAVECRNVLLPSMASSQPATNQNRDKKNCTIS